MSKNEFITFESFKKEALRDPEIKRLYDEMELEFKLAEILIRKRLSKKLTQKQLAEKVGTKQSAIARLESGSHNPSLRLLSKVAKALDTKVTISL